MLGEPVAVYVALEMVDGVEGFVVKDSEGAGSEGADEEATEEAGGVGDGDGVDVSPGDLGVVHGLVDDGEDCLEVASGGDFGDDAAVGFEDVDLRDDDVRKKFAVL